MRARCLACGAFACGPGIAPFSPTAGQCGHLASDKPRFVFIPPDAGLVREREDSPSSDDFETLPIECTLLLISVTAAKCGKSCLPQNAACAASIVLLFLSRTMKRGGL